MIDKAFLITRENLIGSIAEAILQLKRLKERKTTTKDISFFITLVHFLDNANNEDYKKLLYDRHFIISKDVLTNLHLELKEKYNSANFDFKELIQSLSGLSENSNVVDIDALMNKFKEIAHILWEMKTRRQIFM